MKALLHPIRGLWKLGGRGQWFTCGVLMVLAGIEVLGRRCRSDWQDALFVCMLAMLATAVALYHRREGLGWVDRLMAIGPWARSVWRRNAFVVGIDLRGRPPLPQRCPVQLLVCVLTTAVLAPVVVVGAAHFPADVRILAHVCYLGHLLILMLLWSALLFGMLVCAFAPAAMIHDRFVNAYTGHRRRRLWPEFSTIAVYFMVVAAGGLLLPLWVPLCLLLLPLIGWLVVGRASLRWDAHILWKYRQREQIWSVPLGSWLTYQVASVTLLIASLEILSCGAAVLGRRTECDATPITAGLGTGLVWLAPGLMWFALGQLAWARLRDPARPCRPVLHVGGDDARGNLAMVARWFRTKGWDVRKTPTQRRSQDVCVHLTSEAVEQTEEVPPRWPLRVTARELVESAEVTWRLERRLQTLRRRQLIGGLRKLFKSAARRKYKAGTGYWVAPHLWFILGLCRDTEEENPKWRDGTILAETIGPHYHRVLSHGARHHAFEVFRAVEIDIILVEDGVGFRRFCRVLRMLFEIYDIYGGRRRALEVHFQGIPGVRVIIHEFRLDNPFKSEVYPEPEYDDLGRARILHVFRDREEHEEPLESPIDDTRVPAGVHS